MRRARRCVCTTAGAPPVAPPPTQKVQGGFWLRIRVSGPPASRGHRPTRGDRGTADQNPSPTWQSQSGRRGGPSTSPWLPTRDWKSPTQDPGPGWRLQHSSTDRHSGLQPLENSSPPKRGAGRPALHRRGFNPAAPGKNYSGPFSMSLARVMFFGYP